MSEPVNNAEVAETLEMRELRLELERTQRALLQAMKDKLAAVNEAYDRAVQYNAANVAGICEAERRVREGNNRAKRVKALLHHFDHAIQCTETVHVTVHRDIYVPGQVEIVVHVPGQAASFISKRNAKAILYRLLAADAI